MDYDAMRENAMGWQKRAYRAEAKIAEVRATAEYWQSDTPRLPQALRQGAATILSIVDQEPVRSRLFSTAEELSGLPDGAVLRGEDGTLWVRDNEQWVWVFGPYYSFGDQRQPLQHGPAYLLWNPDSSVGEVGSV